MNTPVTYPLAKLLKEKGFDKNTEANWWILAEHHSENYKKGLPVDETKIFFTRNSQELSLKTQIDEEREHNVYHVLGVPTISDIVAWLYKDHRIWVEVNHLPNVEKFGFISKPLDFKKPKEFPSYREYYAATAKFLSKDKYDSPTEAYEAGILYALNNLL